MRESLYKQRNQQSRASSRKLLRRGRNKYKKYLDSTSYVLCNVHAM